METDSLETFLELEAIDRDIGFEASLGIQYRPLLTNNIIFNAVLAALLVVLVASSQYACAPLVAGGVGAAVGVAAERERQEDREEERERERRRDRD
jgi:hypothetical protein